MDKTYITFELRTGDIFTYLNSDVEDAFDRLREDVANLDSGIFSLGKNESDRAKTADEVIAGLITQTILLHVPLVGTPALTIIGPPASDDSTAWNKYKCEMVQEGVELIQSITVNINPKL